MRERMRQPTDERNTAGATDRGAKEVNVSRLQETQNRKTSRKTTTTFPFRGRRTPHLPSGIAGGWQGSCSPNLTVVPFAMPCASLRRRYQPSWTD